MTRHLCLPLTFIGPAYAWVFPFVHLLTRAHGSHMCVCLLVCVCMCLKWAWIGIVLYERSCYTEHYLVKTLSFHWSQGIPHYHHSCSHLIPTNASLSSLELMGCGSQPPLFLPTAPLAHLQSHFGSCSRALLGLVREPHSGSSTGQEPSSSVPPGLTQWGSLASPWPGYPEGLWEVSLILH